MSRSVAERIGQTAGQMDLDVPNPDPRHAFAGEANPADALPAFEDGIVTDADGPELQHSDTTKCLSGVCPDGFRPACNLKIMVLSV